MKKSLAGLKPLIVADIKYNKECLKAFKGDKNPQVIEMYNMTKGKLEALETVLQYVNTGSDLYFDKKIVDHNVAMMERFTL